mmetsp:Transcript_33641/g.56525  ORF Transcript_33641/g.56525 Transcript_33641/m.56525 type:complete len:278 (+) Transcript_33641:269-1102(+)|eukprot:CAMPEP_0198209098 /NCGR_PEP_ID=MMETSP1445-20131203/12415_1 /TAXON_ID=36898 /ORGANISM="Pyramimonas sp., Strain CCMP2087" /LENGTH=277 /DNA_ID=CAMNT_0043882735 /DNA_START=200 /DNA_END=1033 /DNA_ORIENTATION=+
MAPSECPVVGSNNVGGRGEFPIASSGSNATSMFTRLASPSAGKTEKDAPASACPIKNGNTELDPKNNMFPPNQLPGPDQRVHLSTTRVASTIPKGDFTPQHQSKAEPVWVYPSEQMFYNAMKRKGWQPSEYDMPSVIAIHNVVNERCWHEILTWERLHTSQTASPTLNRFEGRPKDLSPKARFLNWMGYKLPFDRHDWFVNRGGEEVRYVIDFYNAKPLPDQPVAMHLDVRPALDSVGAVFDRMRMQGGWIASGRWFGDSQPPAAAEPSSKTPEPAS